MSEDQVQQWEKQQTHKQSEKLKSKSPPLHQTRPGQRPKQEQHVPPEALMQFLFLFSNIGIKFVYRGWSCFQKVLTELRLRELADEVGVFLGSHPIAAVVVAVMTVACGIPILIFVAFAIITVFLTFSGFLIIEGTVLAAGSLALVTCLIAMTVAFTVMGILGAILYCSFMQVAGMVGMTVTNEDPQFGMHLPRILASLRQIPSTPAHRHHHHTPTASTISNPPHSQSNGFPNQNSD